MHLYHFKKWLFLHVSKKNLETDNYASEVILQRKGVQNSSSQCNEWVFPIYRESDLCCQDIEQNKTPIV